MYMSCIPGPVNVIMVPVTVAEPILVTNTVYEQQLLKFRPVHFVLSMTCMGACVSKYLLIK